MEECPFIFPIPSIFLFLVHPFCYHLFDSTLGHLYKKENEPLIVKTTAHSKTKTKKIPRTSKPENMTLAEWQTALRR